MIITIQIRKVPGYVIIYLKKIMGYLTNTSPVAVMQVFFCLFFTRDVFLFTPFLFRGGNYSTLLTFWRDGTKKHKKTGNQVDMNG